MFLGKSRRGAWGDRADGGAVDSLLEDAGLRGPDWLFGGFTGEPAGGLGLGPGPDPLGGEGGLRSSLFAGLGGPSRPFPWGNAANPATNTDRTSKALKPVTNCTRCMLNSFKN